MCVTRLHHYVFIHHNHAHSLQCASYLIHKHHFPRNDLHASSSYWRSFYGTGGSSQGGCIHRMLRYYRQPFLELFLWTCAVAPCYITCPKPHCSSPYLFSPGSSYIYHPVHVPLHLSFYLFLHISFEALFSNFRGTENLYSPRYLLGAPQSWMLFEMWLQESQLKRSNLFP